MIDEHILINHAALVFHECDGPVTQGRVPFLLRLIFRLSFHLTTDDTRERLC